MDPLPSLIVTLQMDDAAQAFFNAQRVRYYPAYANRVAAHLTLFHYLPENQSVVRATLAAQAAMPVFDLEVTGLFNMGKGLAYTLQSNVLAQWHKNLQQSLAPWLIPRDRQPLWPHVTIQQRVTTYKATQLQRQLEQDFQPFTVQAMGICGWHYQQGAWTAAGAWAFGKKQA
ncbi:2'-5' RNA ligase superfamily protein [Chitinophaga costaii]|uniref:2'-5' RNA ligase superfamily protein n=1 Tax=Chitinophaga costaii TaxID=1335309 RepID=A0A1C4EZU2_9BACT|nr:2'-5' RNA ligase family protein [Chitinophaga costaii]PUZ21505.1 2'-5' RNA ligase family protein [Chitinophaga costaii]SCC49120.1 2'-5' RNA ligase superfamily protein [Chitinophaga costaii]